MQVLVLCSITLATILYIVGFVMLFRYKHDKIKLIEEELEALGNILNSCDKMVDELNNLSGYIVSNLEEKSLELKGMLEKADKKIKPSNSQISKQKDKESSIVIKETKEDTKKITKEDKTELPKQSKKKANQEKEDNSNQKTNNSRVLTKPLSTVVNAYEKNINLIKKKELEKDKKPKFLSEEVVIEDNALNDINKKFAFIVNSKTKEVVELSNQGMNTTDIAKKLGIGKGEIELILGMKK